MAAAVDFSLPVAAFHLVSCVYYRFLYIDF